MSTFAEHLQKPTIDSVVSQSVNGHCWVALHCSSGDEGVAFSWHVKPPSAIGVNTTTLNCNPAVLMAKLSTTQGPVEFTCTTGRSMESSSSVITPKCDGEVTIHFKETS